MRVLLAAMALIAVSTAPAFAFRAVNGLAVEQTGDHEFRVAYGAMRRNTDFLCAAADYVSRGLGLPGSTRIYRESPAPRRPGDGLTFTLDPAKKVPMRLVLQLWLAPGDGGISVVNAKSSYCPVSGGDWRWRD